MTDLPAEYIEGGQFLPIKLRLVQKACFGETVVVDSPMFWRIIFYW